MSLRVRINNNFALELCELNTFEICLLIAHLARNQEGLLVAKHLAASMRDKAEVPSQEEISHAFDQIFAADKTSPSAPPGNFFELID